MHLADTIHFDAICTSTETGMLPHSLEETVETMTLKAKQVVATAAPGSPPLVDNEDCTVWTPAALNAVKGLWNRLKRRKTRKIDPKEVADLAKDTILREMPVKMITDKLWAWKKKFKTPKHIRTRTLGLYVNNARQLLTFIYLNVFYVTFILHFIN